MRGGNKAFTLIEVSVVVILMGLLVGFVLVGRDLIRSSQINGAMTDMQKYVSAALTFQQKYGYLPGDMPNATTFWGAAGGNSGDNYTSSCYASGSPANPATCNGNGNGQVSESAAYWDEQFRFWQHLGDAQMIEGHFSGAVGGAGAQDSVIGTNCPASKIKGAGYGFEWVGVMSGDSNYFDGNYKHVMVFGTSYAGWFPINPILSTSEALAFDIKYDDKLPATGNVRTWKTTGPSFINSCATTSVTSTAVYNPSVTSSWANGWGAHCSMIYITGF